MHRYTVISESVAFWQMLESSSPFYSSPLTIYNTLDLTNTQTYEFVYRTSTSKTLKMPEIEEIDDEEAQRVEAEELKKKQQDDIDHAKVKLD